jgi:hypothetical protein
VAADAGVSAQWAGEWERALAELELSVEEAEAALRSDHGAPPRPWVRPEGLGPLPASLEQRVRALLDRQLEVARRTGEEIVRGRRQAAALRALRTAPGAVPVYLDLQG